MKNIKTYYKSHKRAFTMLELIFTIIATGIIMSLSYRYYSQYRWVQAVDKLDKNVYFFANSGVMNTTTGYINATGGNCSSDNSYKNLSAGRMLKCTGYSSAYPVGGVSSDDGTKSWVTNLLKAYMPSNKTCKLYFMEKSSNEYYMFLDCSDLDYEGGSSRAKEFLEQKVNSYIKSNLPTIYQSVNFDSTAINNSTGGNDHDGMLRILMKK